MNLSKFKLGACFFVFTIAIIVLFNNKNLNDFIKKNIAPTKVAADTNKIDTIKKSDKKNYAASFKGLPLNSDTIKLSFENKNLDLKLPVYIENNRYYIPLTEILDELSGKSSIQSNMVSAKLNNTEVSINAENGSFTKNNNNYKLKGKIFRSDELTYISLYDFCNIFDLKTRWNLSDKTISLFNKREKNIAKPAVTAKSMALIRLEDITAGGLYNSTEALEKLRIVGDYLYDEDIPFHIAWVPLYVNPNKKINNNLCTDNNMYNSDFIFTLDYLSNKNGIIGLHGYSHQYGSVTSVDGFEFHHKKNDGIPDSEAYAEERVQNAINAAAALNIPQYFFETPHYGILPPQMKVLEKHFKYIYQPYSLDGGIHENNSIVEINNGDKVSKYIPTPINYVDGKGDVDNVINKIKHYNPNVLRSFFYHSHIEFEDIKLTNSNDGYPTYIYSDNSVLHRLIKVFNENGYKFKPITDL